MRPAAPSCSKYASTQRAALNWGLLGTDCNSFRLSIEWSRLYPRQGELNKAAVERYNAIFDTLERCGHLQQADSVLTQAFQSAASAAAVAVLAPASVWVRPALLLERRPGGGC